MTKLSSENDLLTAALESPEMAPFAMFTIDASQMRHVDGPHKGELMFPELKGEETPLWNIRSNGGNEVDHKKEEKQAATATRKLRVATLAQRVEDGLPLFRDDETPPQYQTPHDEWERFFGGETPTQKMAHWVGEE